MARRRKRRRKNKGKALRIHSFRRAIERYDLYLTEALREEIVGKIRRNQSTPVEKQSHRLSVHDVQLDSGEEVRVVYDKRRQQLVTFLYKDPADYLKPGPGKVAEGEIPTAFGHRDLKRCLAAAKVVPEGSTTNPDLLNPDYFSVFAVGSSGVGKCTKITKHHIPWGNGGRIRKEKAEEIRRGWEEWLASLDGPIPKEEFDEDGEQGPGTGQAREPRQTVRPTPPDHESPDCG